MDTLKRIHLTALSSYKLFGTAVNSINVFLISSFRRVQNVVCFLWGDSTASDFYMPTFRNTLSVPSSKAGVKWKNQFFFST